MEPDNGLADLKLKLNSLKVGESFKISDTSFTKNSEQETMNMIDLICQSRLPPIPKHKPRVHMPGIKITEEMKEKELEPEKKRMAQLQKIKKKLQQENEENEKKKTNCCKSCGKAKIEKESGHYDDVRWLYEICSDPLCGISEATTT